MPDAAELSLDALNDPERYVRKDAVPLFIPHKRQLVDDEGKVVEREVTAKDIPDIVEHMREMERSGRGFRLSNGHIKKFELDKHGNRVEAQESEQPELLAIFRNARLGEFGPDKVPCVLVDEYARRDKLDTLKNRPYRSAEYYPRTKVITGAAALLRDPQLNLGIVLYESPNEAWYYAEPITDAPAQAGGKTDLPAKPDDRLDKLSPEQVECFELMIAYHKKKFPKLYEAAAGPLNAEQPMADTAKTPDQFKLADHPELYALKQELDTFKAKYENEKAVNDELAKKINESSTKINKDDCNRRLDQLEKIEHFELDRAEEFEAMLATDEAGREKIAKRIRTRHKKLPGHDDQIEVYSGELHERQKGVHDAPKNHESALEIMRATPGMTYDEAVRKTAK